MAILESNLTFGEGEYKMAIRAIEKLMVIGAEVYVIPMTVNVRLPDALRLDETAKRNLNELIENLREDGVEVEVLNETQ